MRFACSGQQAAAKTDGLFFYISVKSDQKSKCVLVQVHKYKQMFYYPLDIPCRFGYDWVTIVLEQVQTEVDMCMNGQCGQPCGGRFGQDPGRDCGTSGANRPGDGVPYAAVRCMNWDRNGVSDAKRRSGMMDTSQQASPCESCIRVRDPGACENKNCKVWKAWFLRRWAAIYGYGRLHGVAKKGN